MAGTWRKSRQASVWRCVSMLAVQGNCTVQPSWDSIWLRNWSIFAAAASACSCWMRMSEIFCSWKKNHVCDAALASRASVTTPTNKATYFTNNRLRNALSFNRCRRHEPSPRRRNLGENSIRTPGVRLFGSFDRLVDNSVLILVKCADRAVARYQYGAFVSRRSVNQFTHRGRGKVGGVDMARRNALAVTEMALTTAVSVPLPKLASFSGPSSADFELKRSEQP